MGAILMRLVPLAINYIEQHPEVVDAIFHAVIKHIEDKNATAPKAVTA